MDEDLTMEERRKRWKKGLIERARLKKARGKRGGYDKQEDLD